MNTRSRLLLSLGVLSIALSLGAHRPLPPMATHREANLAPALDRLAQGTEVQHREATSLVRDSRVLLATLQGH